MALVALLSRLNIDPEKLVYLLPRKAAIKIPLKPTDSMAKELKRWSLMYHSNIVQLNEIINSETNGLIAVSQRCEGSVRDIMRKKSQFQEDEAYQVIRSCAEALSYTFIRHSVLHLDLKPENVLFGSQSILGHDRNPMIFDHAFILESSFMVTDWGISFSKLNANCGTYDDRWLHTNNNSGTIPYMAPERYLKGWRSSPASVIFSLGIMWLELLCGQLPFNMRHDIPHQILSGEYYLRALDMLSTVNARPKVRKVILDFITPNPKKRTSSWDNAIKMIRPHFLKSLIA